MARRKGKRRERKQSKAMQLIPKKNKGREKRGTIKRSQQVTRRLDFKFQSRKWEFLVQQRKKGKKSKGRKQGKKMRTG